MTQEDKELLLKDLCARLSYGIFVKENRHSLDGSPVIYTYDYHPCISNCKPYLRPLSSMTKEECVELSRIRPFNDEVEAWKYIKTPVPLKIANIKHFDFFHSHHLDWRGLIEKGLALEAPKGMYK